MYKAFLKHKVSIGIGIIWLFHISALVGIALGHLDWFIKKTPFNLGLSLLLFLLIYPINSRVKSFYFILFFSGGMLAEWSGVNYQLLFGTYSYGENFGPKLDSVPFLIGAYWAILTFISAAITDYLKIHRILKAILGAGLMVLLDLFMEQSAPLLDFWTFKGGMPNAENYITWFCLGLLFQLLLQREHIGGNKAFSLNLYLAQLVFFSYFMLFY